MKEIFGKRLRELRIKSSETQSDLALELKVGVSMISLWENGINYPEVKKLIEICAHYEISADYLLGLSENPKR